MLDDFGVGRSRARVKGKNIFTGGPADCTDAIFYVHRDRFLGIASEAVARRRNYQLRKQARSLGARGRRAGILEEFSPHVTQRFALYATE